MNEDKFYNFMLVLSNVREDTPDLEDKLFEAGCDDALINFRNGAVYLDFDRKAKSLEEAVLSAIHQVEGSGLPAKVVHLEPDNLVNETEIANRLALGRQTVSLWVKGKRRALNQPFPSPFMKLQSKSPLWRWNEVLEWVLKQNLLKQRYSINDANFVEDINLILLERNEEKRKHCGKLLKALG